MERFSFLQFQKWKKMTQKCKKSEKCRFFVLIRGVIIIFRTFVSRNKNCI
nr:MAG TPA: hypothetical protein [Caudoviricetes sp.]